MTKITACGNINAVSYTHLEIAFIKLTTPSMEQNLDSILQRITLLEQKMQEMPDNLQKLASLAPAAGQAASSKTAVVETPPEPKTVSLPPAQYEDCLLYTSWVSESCLSWEETIRVIEVLRRHPVIYDMYVSEGGVSETRLLAQLEEYGIPERECAYILSLIHIS